MLISVIQKFPEGKVILFNKRHHLFVRQPARPHDPGAFVQYRGEVTESVPYPSHNGHDTRAPGAAGEELSSGPLVGENYGGLDAETEQGEEGDEKEEPEREGLEDHPIVIPLHQVEFEGGEGADRGRVFVVDHRIPGEERPPSGQASPQPQVGVFAVGEEFLVKEADLVEHSTTIEGDTGGWEKNFLHSADRKSGKTLQAIGPARHAIPANADAERIDKVMIVKVAYSACDHAGPGMFVCDGDQLFQPSGVSGSIIVEGDDIFSPGNGESRVVPGCKSPVFRQFYQYHPRVFHFNERNRIIGRAIVHKNNFEVPVSLDA